MKNLRAIIVVNLHPYLHIRLCLSNYFNLARLRSQIKVDII